MDLTDPRIVRALSHPLRSRILMSLDEGEASPVELSKRLDASLGTVSYHVNILADLGLIKLVRTTPRRGALEHHYRAAPRPAAKRDKWDKLPAAARGELAGKAAVDLADALAGAAKSGGFSRRGASIETATLELDETGWSELSKELKDLSKRVSSIARDSSKRLAKSGETGVEAGLAVALFELARAESSPKARSRGKRGPAAAKMKP